MNRLNHPAELEIFRQDILKRRERIKKRVRVCAGPACASQAGEAIAKALQDTIAEKGLQEEFWVTPTGCHGFCARGPIAVIEPENIFYEKLRRHHVPDIVNRTLIGGEIIEELLYTNPADGKKIVHEAEIPFYANQEQIVFRDSGKNFYSDIEDYISRGGYTGLVKALSQLTPEEIVEEVKLSGLRGRGGGGFPAGTKWESCRKAKGAIKYVICNADEGDPGAYMDRALLEGNPHQVIEGMIIGAYAIGAVEGYIYCRYEYPMATKNAIWAIQQAKELGLLGPNILGTPFSLEIFVTRGAGAFVCGESTALMASLEGKVGEPRGKHIHTVDKGLWNRPSNLNNVETWATVPLIINQGGSWHASIGTERSKGTKIFSLVGKINNSGLVEVSMGTPLKKIIYDIGGGIPGGREFKAVQTGGPSGGCIPKALIDLPVDYEKLKEAGSMMGSGGMIVLDEETCMVDVARYFLNFLEEESCGKCVPCRLGVKRMHEIVTSICQGEGQEGDIQRLQSLGEIITEAALCGLGKSSSNPVLSTIKYFREEYEAHIRDKECPAGVCRRLTGAPCQKGCPAGIDVPSYVALTASGHYEQALEIIRADNPFPSVCGRICNHGCEVTCTRGEVDSPIAIMQLKRFLSDFEGTRPLVLPQPVPKTKVQKVAVVGGGPAGLSAAYFLVRKGYPVTLFEASPVLGGMLALAIPEFRLPREHLQRDIQHILALGVEVRTQTPIGKDLTLEQLKNQGYEALFLATGAHQGLEIGVFGENLYEGTIDALDFLKKITSSPEPLTGKRVVVVGGGYAAVDAARAAIRLGASVNLVYRRAEEDLPADPLELRAAREEGVQFHFLTTPTKITAKANRVTGLECLRLEPVSTDTSGRRRMLPKEGTEFLLPAEWVIAAVGLKPDLSFFSPTAPLSVAIGQTLAVDPETLQTQIPSVFAGGDLITGMASVIEAVAVGKRAAWAMDNYLSGQDNKLPPSKPRLRLEKAIVPEGESVPTDRPEMGLVPVKERSTNFQEAELGLSEKQALDEARRCLRCDLTE